MTRKLIAVLPVAMALQVAAAETWYWSPTVVDSARRYLWNNENNWTNTAATRGFPHAGDTAVLGWGETGTGPYNACGTDASYALHEVRFEGDRTIAMNQGKVVLRGGGGGLKFMHDKSCINNWLGLWAVGDGEVPIHVDKGVDYAIQLGLQKQGDGNPTIVKTGPGRFICSNQARSLNYTIPLTLIRQGAYDITISNALNGVSFAFDGDDESQRICFCYLPSHNIDLILNNIGFYETNGVNNTGHGFSAQNDKQVKFTGTPKQNPTVFSGKFYNKAGLNWSPDSSDYTFICSNAVSATQGSVIVSNGMVKLVTGASFTALKLLDVAAGATFEVEEGSGANFHADNLALADATAQLKLGEGVMLEMGAATLNGNALPHGTYSADGANGTCRAAWITGMGKVSIINGPDAMTIPVQINSVKAQQRYPWNGLVDITCLVSGIDETSDVKFALSAVMPDSGSTNKLSHVYVVQSGTNSTDLAVSTNGSYRLIWDAEADLGQVRYTNMVVSITLKNTHGKVQLWEGGPYWATTNIGAEEPEDYGYYFWWGDTIGYKRVDDKWVASNGSSSDFSFVSGNTPTCGKSLSVLQNMGWITTDNILVPSYDAAQMHWGGGWRMPTEQELDDLCNKCSWTWVTMNGVNGYVIRGLGEYDSANIFLPAVGVGGGTSLKYASGSYGSGGNYWSSVPYSDNADFACCLYFNSSDHYMGSNYRYSGRPIRPVQGLSVDQVSMVELMGDSAPFLLDTRTGVRESEGVETLTYSSLWDGDASSTMTIAQDGVALAEGLTGEGERTWNVQRAGTYVLTHTTYTNSVAGKVESATFFVAAKDIALAQVDVDCSAVTYSGSAFTPTTQSATWGGNALVEGIDYTLTYANNVNAGTATITLTGINFYNGTYTTNFTIRPRPLMQGMVGAIGNHPYTGKAQTPKPTVTDAERGVTLREDVEYTLSYANNTALGDGVVTVTGIGNYTGAIARAFVIEPSAGSELEDILGGAGKVESDGEDGWIVTITNDIDSADLPIEIPDDVGPVTIDLGGHDLTGNGGRLGEAALPGGDGQPAIRILPGKGDGEPTVLTVVTTGGDATVKGGDGGAGNPGGNGAPAIEVADGAQDGVLVNIGAGVTVQGGNGGASDSGHGGYGGAGIVGDVGTNDGTIAGGDGGASDTGDGGTGGPGVDGDMGENNGSISGGAGGASEYGNDGNPGVGVTGDVGTNNGTIVMPSVKVDLSLKVGEYFKATLSELGYDVPTNGTPYSVVAKGLPAGLKLKYNPAWKNKKGKVVIKAKSEWWIEGVPTAALDFATNPPYLVITAEGQTETYALSMEVKAQEVTELDDLALGQSLNVQFYLPGVTNGWTVSGLPKGLKYTAKRITEKLKSGKQTLVVTKAMPYTVYGKTTKAGLYTITAKKKVGAFYETMKYRVLVRPKPVDTTLFGDLPTNLVTMAYVPVAWDLKEGGEWDGGHAGRVPLPAVPTVAKVMGLPGGVAFASANTYYDKKKTKLKQSGQTIVGTPTKPGTYVVTFTRNVKEKVKGKVKTVAKTAQMLWVVEPNDVEVEVGFNDKGGVIESGVVGLKYGDLLAFSATSNATVTASGLPAGIKLVKVEEGGERGRLGEAALPGEATYAFTGFTTKAGTYLVTVKATLKGKTVTQRLALKVEGLPAWAKGTFNGVVSATGETPVVPVAGGDATGETPVVPVDGQDARSTNGLATVTVSAVGKISGKFQGFGTNWTFSAASYTAAVPGTRDACPYQEFICSNIVAKYAYKVKEKVKGKVKTVTKYVTREFAFTVSPVPVVPNVPDVSVRGVVTMTEDAARSASGPYQSATLITAWQNLWGRADYKAAGKKLFYTSKKKPYKTFAYGVYTNETGSVCFVKDGEGGRLGEAALPGLTYFAALSLKVTTAGAVTATLSYDTGRTKKDPKTKKTVKVIYKATCQSVVVPQGTADAEPFAGEVPLYFAPSAANGFDGFAGSVAVP